MIRTDLYICGHGCDNDVVTSLHTGLRPSGETCFSMATCSKQVFLTALASGVEEEEEQEERLEEQEEGEDGEAKDVCDRALQRWFEGPAYDSEEYDTDLEEDFPPGWCSGEHRTVGVEFFMNIASGCVRTCC